MLPEHPSTWPQRPLMIRASPRSSTKVRGIRLVQQNEYEEFMDFTGDHLPINNGKESKGESMVIDFESIHFIGTLFIRIKQAPTFRSGGNNKSCKPDDENEASRDVRKGQHDYFANKKRKFHVVIKGRFKKSLSMSRCVTGQIFERPPGKLPALWLIKSAISSFSILAPQLDASLDDKMPRFLSPLVATAQTVLSENDISAKCRKNVDEKNMLNYSHPSTYGDRHLNLDTVADHGEPSSVEVSSILSDLRTNVKLGIRVPDTTSFSVTSRTSTRKKIFNTLSAKISLEPRFDTNKLYTFEFYQHLLDFGDELAVDMGKIGCMLPLAQPLNGQPIKIFAAHKKSDLKLELDVLWSFDIFHESLYSYVESALD